MLKRIVATTVGLIAIVAIAFISFGVWKTSSERPTFYTSGYVLQGDSLDGSKQIEFQEETVFVSSKAGVVTFDNISGDTSSVPTQSFVNFNDGNVMSFTDGVLVDFADLSNNFINNYHIDAMLRVNANGGQYTTETTAGTMTFDENLWKLSDQKYLIQSPTLKVHFSDSDVREVADYVQVSVSDDGIVNVLTTDNVWATISESFYIETEGGVQINPVTQLITDGNYTMSMAKLSVNADDVIKLTEDETRRQIVPELTFEVINGEDGESGVAGQAGIAGEDGAAGIDGVIGEIGLTGEAGEDGDEGDEGEQGEGGAVGETGATGEKGSKGSTGADGLSGDDGAKGVSGASGAAGADATGDSSTNSALPTMTIKNWALSSTSIAGTIAISDVAGYFQEETLTLYNSTYPATVSVYNSSTGETIDCYVATYNETTGIYSVDTSRNETNFNDGNSLYDEAEIHFILPDGEQLSPNTNYQLIVEAYYMMNYDVYSRKFVDETFYTDSAGVYLTKKLATTSTLELNTIISTAYQSSVEQVEVVLLTASQMKNYTYLSDDGYTQKYVLDYDNYRATYYSSDSTNGTIVNSVTVSKDNTIVGFEGLTSDTTYYAKIVVTINGLKTMSEQELEVQTLKVKPTWDTDTDPYAYYNRVTGQVDVYRQSVTDDDGAVTEYVYTPYQYDTSTGNWVALTSHQKVMQSYTSGAATFTLSAGYYYYFNVTMVTYNNEQTIEYNLGDTDEIYVQGGSLPGLELVADETGSFYDTYNGTLTILSDANTTIDIGVNALLKIEIRGDLIGSETLSFSTVGDTKTDSNGVYTATLLEDIAGTAYHLDLDFQDLLQNTQYTITVTAYIDFDAAADEYESLSYELGTVSFRTYDTPTAYVTWTTSDDANGTSVISENISLSLMSSTFTDDAITHASDELLDGQVTIELQNASTSKAQGTATITGSDLVSLYSSSGLTLTEASFGKTSIDTSTDLDIVVTEVADGTIFNQNTLGYYNTFDILNSSKDVSFNQSLASLVTSPEKAITATAITKEVASKYGVDPDDYEDYPDDTIIGYELTSNFDNSDRMGETLTYYAMDYSQFYNLVVVPSSCPEFDLSDADSMEELGLGIVSQATIDISSSATIPTVAIIFGNDPDDAATKDYAGEAQFAHISSQGHYVYYAGNENLSNSGELLTGMERGFRYLFAYTAKVANSDGGESYDYPIDRTDQYEIYKDTYGTGLGVTGDIGATKTYMLNSGVLDAPLVEPQIYSYVYDTTDVYASTSTVGTIDLRYAYSDVDDVVITDSSDADYTVISHSLTGIQGFSGEPIGTSIENSATGAWNSLKLQYSVSYQGDKSVVLTPTVNFNLYKVDYTNAITHLTGESATETYYLANIPVEWYWTASDLGTPTISMDIDNEDNKITFSFAIYADYLISRAYGLELTVSAVDKTKQIEDVTLYAGISQSSDGKYYGQISTALLSDFIDERIQYSAKVLYDDGTQGWSNLESDYFALQQTVTSGEFALGNYSGISSNSSSASYKLLQQAYESNESRYLTTDVLENTINLFDTNGNEDTFDTEFKFYATEDGASDSEKWYYLRVYEDGVKDRGSTYFTMKGVGTIDTAVDTNTATGTITSITPTIGYTSSRIYTSTSTGFVLRDFTVTAYEDVFYENVYVNVYYEDPNNIGSPDYTNELKLENGYSNFVTLNASGNYVADSLTNEGTFVFDTSELYDTNQTFYIVLSMSDDDGATTYTVLKTSGEKAEYSFYLASQFTFYPIVDATTGSEILYKNTSYFDKYLYFQYQVSRDDEVYVTYDIVDAKGEVVISHETMQSEGMYTSNMAFDNLPTTITGNILLTPSATRGLLTTGVTYSVVVTAYDTGTAPIGTYEYDFVLPVVISTGATINITDASYDNLTYQVTITDTEYALMGTPATNQTSGLYAVRFTDSVGRQIFTTYDDQVFNAGVPRQSFTLSDDTLEGYVTDANSGTQTKYSLTSGETYWINIYAVIDSNFDSLGPDTTVDENEDYYQKGYTDFFGATNGVYPFNTYIDYAWTQNSGQSNSYKTTQSPAIEKAFNIETLAQETIESGDLLIKNASLARNGTAFRLTLSESFGVISTTDEQAFDKIQWSVSGSTYDGKTVTQNGISYDGSDTMFVEYTTTSGATTYYYDIPYEFDTGEYKITIQLYQNNVLYQAYSFTMIEA
ncbi:hypothetical protein [Chakrabartyella piscis]|uniref:hypothetical protein n=1 Tax=Chakrabartyella piscis TaxID=2918914 RepID=UPI00295862BF|nr:hypothetical protein [Chakrabartyella piscis]